MSKNIIRTLITATATAAIMAVFIALACAPTAQTTSEPTSQAPTTPSLATEPEAEQPFQVQTPRGNESVKPQEPTPTEHPIGPPPTSWPENPIVEHNLQRKLDGYMARKEEARRTRSTIEPQIIHIIVLARHNRYVDEITDLMNEHSVGRVVSSMGDNTYVNAGGASGYVPMEVIQKFSALEGVWEIYEVVTSQPSGALQQQANPTASAAQVLGVDKWHAAKVKGSGVEIGIIDFDFRDFSTRVANPSSDKVKFLCFDNAGRTSENSFAECLRTHATPMPSPHGTDVAEALYEIAPETTLYVSNANSREQTMQAVQWMTAKDQDNGNGNSAYTVTDNDDFDVRVINLSQSYPWDGPGDGTSPFSGEMEPSVLNTISSAANNEALWINSAGNSNQRNWFKRSPTFNASNYLEFQPSGANNDCNRVNIQAGQTLSPQLRWSGTWPRANIDLNLHLSGPVTQSSSGTIVASSLGAQSGQANHFPRETLSVTTLPTGMNAVQPGTYCLYVSKNVNDAYPDWVQLQVFTPTSTTLSQTTNAGSIDNPAESANPSMLAVGATDNSTAFTIKDFSSRGPAPEPYPPSRVKPDVVSINTALLGTSFAAPRIAGLAALVIQALGDQSAYDTPSEIASYLKTKATQLGTGRPNNEYGYGIVKLPGLNPPTNLVLQHQSCNRDAHLVLTFDPPDWDAINDEGTNVRYQGYVRLDPAIPGELSQVQGLPERGENHLKFRTVRDARYYAVVQACPVNGLNNLCSIPSQQSAHVTVPAEVCAPERLHGIPGDGRITLRWNHERHATSYQIEDENGNITAVSDGQSQQSSNLHLEIKNLTNGTPYRFRIRAIGTPGTSAWSEWITATLATTNDPVPVGQVDAYISSGESIKLYWFEDPSTANYKVQQWDGTAGQWRRLPFREKGKSAPYQVHFFYPYGQAQAKVTGLQPGNTYTYRIMGLNGTDASEWSQQFSFQSAPGGPPITQPSPTPTPEPNKSEPRNLTAALSGTDVALNWTKGYNPNFDTQAVRRKTQGSGAIVEFPTTLNDETYTDTSTTSGDTYIYRIVTVKKNGVKITSNFAKITIP